MTVKYGTPLRAFALLRAIVDDERFVRLGAPAKVAILVAVIRYADHNGRWFAKQATLGDGVGRSGRRVREALAACVRAGLLVVAESRRPDGTRGANEYVLAADLVEHADETIRMWTSKRTHPSPGASTDESVRLTSPDETVRAVTALNGSLNELSDLTPEETVELERLFEGYGESVVDFADEATKSKKLRKVTALAAEQWLLDRRAGTAA